MLAHWRNVANTQWIDLIQWTDNHHYTFNYGTYNVSSDFGIDLIRFNNRGALVTRWDSYFVESSDRIAHERDRWRDIAALLYRYQNLNSSRTCGFHVCFVKECVYKITDLLFAKQMAPRLRIFPAVTFPATRTRANSRDVIGRTDSRVFSRDRVAPSCNN